MMLLMGMKMSLMKKPTNPMMTNPIAIRAATLVNSARRSASDLAKEENEPDLDEKARVFGPYPCGRACGSA